MEIKKRIRKNIVCLILLGICVMMGLMSMKYCINTVFIIRERNIETLGELFFINFSYDYFNNWCVLFFVRTDIRYEYEIL